MHTHADIHGEIFHEPKVSKISHCISREMGETCDLSY